MSNQPIDGPCPSVNTYEDYLKTGHWKSLRSQAFERYGCKCELCGTERPIRVHHLRYRARWWHTLVEDLMVVCARCHKLIHQNHGMPHDRDFLITLYRITHVLCLTPNPPKRKRKKPKWRRLS